MKGETAHVFPDKLARFLPFVNALMARPKLVPTNNLCLFPVPEESTLSLVEDSQVDAQTSKPVENVVRIASHLGAQTPNPIRATSTDYEGEDHLPSRVQRRRKTLRLERQGLLKAEVWCTMRHLPFQELVDELLRAFNAGTLPSFGHLDAQTPTDRSDDLNMNDERELDQQSGSSSASSILAGRPDAQPPPDSEQQRIEELVCFYEVTTGNRASPEDVEALRSVFELSDDLINTGILRSVIYCSKRVGSFKYCVKTIRQIAKSRIDPREEFYRMYDTFFAKVKGGQLILPRESASFLEGKFGKTKDADD